MLPITPYRVEAGLFGKTVFITADFSTPAGFHTYNIAYKHAEVFPLRRYNHRLKCKYILIIPHNNSAYNKSNIEYNGTLRQRQNGLPHQRSETPKHVGK